MADDAGALLVRSGLVSPSALEDARSRVEEHGGTLGEQLVVAGAVADEALTDFYRQRLLVPHVNPNTLARLPTKVVTTIPSDLAIELRVIPVSLDADNNLTVAMSDPSDRHAVDEISEYTGMYVVRAVATQMQIAWCLAHYYGHVTALGSRLIQPSRPGAVQTPAQAAQVQAAQGPAQAPGPGRAPTPVPRVPRVPRTKGLTGKINAARHRAIVPGGPTDLVRPLSGELDLFALEAAAASVAPPVAAVAAPAVAATALPAPAPAPAPPAPAAPPPAAVAAPAAPPPTPAPDGAGDGVPDRPRARSVSGEIRVPTRVRAASIKPPMPDPHGDGDDDDEPMISVESHEQNDDDDDDDDEPMISVAESTDDAPSGPRMLPIRRRVKTDPPELAARAGEVSLGARPERLIDDQPAIIIAEDQLVQEDFAPDPVSGELRAVSHRDEPDIPTVTIEVDDTSAGVVIHDYESPESEPVLLDRRRVSETPLVQLRAPSNEDGQDTTDDEVVVLDARKKTPTSRAEKRTQIGIGMSAAVTRAHRDTDASPVPAAVEDAPTAEHVLTDDAPTRVDGRAAPEGPEDTDETLAPPPSPSAPVGEDTSPRIAAPAPSGRRRARSVRPRSAPVLAPTDPRAGDDDDDDDDVLPRGPATSVMSAIELDDVIPERRDDVLPAHLDRQRVDYDPVDDGWGPPGTTIPPPLLGALPGIDEDGDAEYTGAIPMSNLNTAPFLVAPPSPPESARGSPGIPEAAGQSLVRTLEDSTSRAIQLIHTLERATDRDGVISLMIAHLAEAHMRAGFFAIRPSVEAGKAGEIAVFKIEPGPPSLPADTLRLDRPSTLQDVVGTRLPYRGPMHDDASRTFLASVLGACPPEILLVPVTVRERVVGVLFGEHRMRHTFDDQLALAARAAGMALERILMAKRG